MFQLSTEIIKVPYMKQEKACVATIEMKKYEIRVSIEFWFINIST